MRVKCRLGFHDLFAIGWGTVRCRRCHVAFTQAYQTGQRLSRIKEHRPTPTLSSETVPDEET